MPVWTLQPVLYWLIIPLAHTVFEYLCFHMSHFNLLNLQLNFIIHGSHGSMPPHIQMSLRWMRKITAVTWGHSRQGWQEYLWVFWTQCIEVWKANRSAPRKLNKDKKPVWVTALYQWTLLKISINWVITPFILVCLNTFLFLIAHIYMYYCILGGMGLHF